MDRQQTHQELPRHANDDEHRCNLCDVIIEVAEHDIFFVTGHCRFCHAALEEDE